MDGAATFSQDDVDDSRRRGRRRRHQRQRGLSEKLRRSQKAARARKIFTVLVLGVGIVITSVYLARTSTAYEPVPVLPTE
jgi:hypothetical protein